MADTCPVVLIAGCGDLGGMIGQQLAHAGLMVFGLRRSWPATSDGIHQLRGDVTQADTLGALATITPNILLYAVAADEQSDENYRTHYVDGLRNVLAAMPHGLLQHVFFISSTRVYGQAGDGLIDESTPPEPADFGGRRLLEAERLFAGLDCPATALRLSGIYGPGRNRLLGLAKHPENWPANSWTNRIHRDDAAAFVVFLIQRVLNRLPVPECCIVTDDCPAPQHEVLAWLAMQMGITVESPVAGLTGGKRLSNLRMRQTGFMLRYPDYRAGYATLL